MTVNYPGAWRLFRYDWEAEPGNDVLLSRATDDAGRRQPARISDPDDWRDALADDEYPWNEGGFAANAYEPNAVEVEVEGGGDAMAGAVPPVYLAIVDDAAVLVFTDEGGTLWAVIRIADATVRDWAIETFETYCVETTRLDPDVFTA